MIRELTLFTELIHSDSVSVSKFYSHEKKFCNINRMHLVVFRVLV